MALVAMHAPTASTTWTPLMPALAEANFWSVLLGTQGIFVGNEFRYFQPPHQHAE
jgi:hypothetical protein